MRKFRIFDGKEKLLNLSGLIFFFNSVLISIAIFLSLLILSTYVQRFLKKFADFDSKYFIKCAALGYKDF
jgi:hypothetical protein